MRTLLRLCMIVALACAPALAPSAAHAAEGPRVLVLTTGNAAQDVADFAVERLQMEGRRWNFSLVQGTPEDLLDLDGYQVVAFVNTGPDLMDDAQRSSLQTFVEGGGGFVGVGSAAASVLGWEFYEKLIGAVPVRPPGPEAKESVSFNAGSPITDGLDEDIELTEPWYAFDPAPADPRQTVLAQLGSGDPVAWHSNAYNSFYASPGADGDTWGDRDFLQLMRQGIWWAAGEEGGLVQNSADAAPSWPYTLTFVLFVIAVAGGGSLAVWRLDKAETGPARSHA